MSYPSDQAGGLVENGQWFEKDGLVHDVHEVNTSDGELSPD